LAKVLEVAPFVLLIKSTSAGTETGTPTTAAAAAT